MLAIASGTLVLPLFTFAQIITCPPAYFCFGGHLFPPFVVCDEGLILFVGPPRPGPVLLTPASLFFPTLFFPGFIALGIALPTPVPCTISGVRNGYVGFPILRGGTSLTPGF